MSVATRSNGFLLLAAFCCLLAAGVLGLKARGVGPERAAAAQVTADLNSLRDRITDRWAALLTGGWNLYVDDQLIFAELASLPAEVKARLAAAPPNEQLQVESLESAVSQILQAEEAYRLAVHELHSNLAQSTLDPMSFIDIHTKVRDQADRLVLGRRFPADVSQPEGDIVPSTDPAALRVAYKALQAGQIIYYRLMCGFYEVQLATAELMSMPRSFDYAPSAIKEPLAALRRLPEVTDPNLARQIEKIPLIWSDMAVGVYEAGEALSKKKAALADLESRVREALAAIDLWRAAYLKQLAE